MIKEVCVLHHLSAKWILFLAVVFLLAFASTAAGSIQYTVQAGDTLESIAQQAGTTVEAIKEANELSGGGLFIGMVLSIETAQINTYTVQEGDSLVSIAERFGFTLEQLMVINHLSHDTVDPGTVLVVVDRLGSQVSRSGDNVAQVRTLLAYADSFLHTPYRYGGTGPNGFDCSGFTCYVFKSADIQLPRTAASQYNLGTSVNKADLQPGDLVFFANGRYIDHVGIYAGDGQFIHSSSPRSGGVIYTPLEDGDYYSRTYVGARRIL